MKKVLALIMAVAMIASLAAIVGAEGVQPEAPAPSAPTLRYVRVDENFGKWSGSGDVSCRIDTAPWRFERLDEMLYGTLADGSWGFIAYSRVASANWSVEGARTVITLNENYLKTLGTGMHWYEAEFWVDDKGTVVEIAENILLEIPKNPVQQNAPAATAAPAAAPAAGGAATGGSTDVPRGGVALAIIPTFLAAGVALVSKKRK